MSDSEFTLDINNPESNNMALLQIHLLAKSAKDYRMKERMQKMPTQSGSCPHL